MILAYHVAGAKLNKYIVDSNIFPVSLQVIQTNARFLGIEVVVKDATKLTSEDLKGTFGVHF